jgi:type IV fimbrial biogenesis protein FimT
MLAAMSRTRARGLSLVELMTVVAVLGIVLAVAAPSFSDLINKYRVRSVATELSTNLAYARSESGLRNQQVALTFGSNSAMTCYTVVVFDGGGGCNCTRASGTAACNNQSELNTVQVPTLSGVSLVPNQAILCEIYRTVKFNPPLRTAGPAGASISVQGVRGYRLDIQLNPIGRVITCSPDGSFSGVAPC